MLVVAVLLVVVMGWWCWREAFWIGSVLFPPIGERGPLVLVRVVVLVSPAV